MNLELRNRIYHATLLVPQDVRASLGKVRFRQSLKTSSRQLAILRAAPLIEAWKLQIAKARGADPYILEAERWKAELAKSLNDNDKQDVISMLISDRAEEIEETDGTEKAKDFYLLASGKATPFDTLKSQWEAQLSMVPKTKEQMIKDVNLVNSRFPTIESLTRKAVHDWAWSRVEQGKNTEHSMARVLAFTRNYWRYLQRAGVVDLDNNPLSLSNMSREKRKGRNTGKTDNLPYSRDDLKNLYDTALSGWGKRPRKQPQLAALIKMGAYTGARIEELCSLKSSDVHAHHFRINDSKTGSGIRDVPIHPHINALFQELKDESPDGFIFSGLTLNKYGDRSNAIGKLFGRLKEHLGFDQRYTFHSLRSTFVTALENMGISENTTADIVGHKKPRITYGLYSGGASLEVKAEC